MSHHLKAVKVSDRVWWVGAIDWTIRDFHGYGTPRGTTYNAYLVIGEKPILIDTVKKPFLDELISRIRSVVDPKEITYFISNHTEMDHSGSLPEMIEVCKPEKVFASVKGVENLSYHFDLPVEVVGLKDGDSLELAGLNFSFLETRMLHWPDSMFTYFAEDKVLFSSDAFGMHLASSERFDRELDPSMMEYEAKKYYANIILLYSPLVLKLLERVSGLGIEIKFICPDHGPIWTERIGWILELYKKWAEHKPTLKAVVVYDTMWKSTEKLARAIEEGLIEEGVSVKVMKLRESHRSDVITELIDAGAIAVGSPTLNNNLFPTVSDFLTYMKGLRVKPVVGAVFGSYGWSGESVRTLKKWLEEMKIELAGEFSCQFVPKEADLEQARALGIELAQRLKEAENEKVSV